MPMIMTNDENHDWPIDCFDDDDDDDDGDDDDDKGIDCIGLAGPNDMVVVSIINFFLLFYTTQFVDDDDDMMMIVRFEMNHFFSFETKKII